MAEVIRHKKRYKLNNFGFNILFKITEADTQEPKDLTGYDAKFLMWVPGSSEVYLDGECRIHDADKGECIYLVKDGDFDRLGIYYAEIQLSRTGVLEDTETFEVTIYGTAPSGCPDVPGDQYEYEGEINMYVNSSHDASIEYGVVGNLAVELFIDSTYVI